MDQIKTQVAKLRAELDKSPVSPILHSLQGKTGLPYEYFVLGLAALLLILLFFGVGASLICNLIGFVFPTYMSFKAIESEGKDDDKQWLTYWVVYAGFNVFEVFSDYLLYWIPFYYVLKVGFLYWLMSPSFNGATTLYPMIRDLIIQHSDKIDQAVRQASKVVADAADKRD